MKVADYCKKLWRIIIDKDERFTVLAGRGFYDSLSDEDYIRRLYRAYFHKEIDLANPNTFNEKLQWLKLYDRNPLYTKLVDKYEVKKYVADLIGEEYIIPTYGVWNHFDEIDFEVLPDQFVLKCTHDSGGIVIVSDKNNFDRKAARKKIEKHLKKNYYKSGREWPYKYVPPRIIAEKYILEADDCGLFKDTHKRTDDILTDYKFMCFDGKFEMAFTCTNRFSKDELRVTFFDKEWNVMPFERHYKKSDEPIDKPSNFELMILIAEKLSFGIPFVRIDFYETQNQLFFGEMTFFPGNGVEEFEPDFWDGKIGDLLYLNKAYGYEASEHL